MGCNMSAPSVDEEGALSRTITPSETPPQQRLIKHNIHDLNRPSGALQQVPPLVAKVDRDRFLGSPQQGMGPSLLNRLGDREESSFGSPSFRCYVNNDIADGKDIVSAICEQRKANRIRLSNSPLRNGTSSTMLSNQEAELNSHKKERGWMSKVLIKRGSDSGNTTVSSH